jgi:hypothetical protein
MKDKKFTNNVMTKDKYRTEKGKFNKKKKKGGGK